MAYIGRSARVWYPGAIYHITDRGVRRQEIFQSKGDYKVFLAILRKAAEQYEVKVHAYCLMTNHIHLLLETTMNAIGQVMQKIAGDYAKYYNRKYHYRGHVFEDRYKSKMVMDEVYFLQISRYIHLNPVKARIVTRPEGYTWSSYRTILGEDNDEITVRGRTLDYYGIDGVQGYKRFVEADLMDNVICEAYEV